MEQIPYLRENLNITTHNSCQICPVAKQSRLSFPTNTSKSFHVFQLLHIDFWGPYKVPTYDMKQYFVTIVDDMSRFTWLCLTQHKTHVHIVLNDFMLLVNTQFGVKVQTERTDNGIEFLTLNVILCFSLLL
ncbi:hypothetical protein AABB24_014456 [Solanum stoloniferum]|uniref:Integrase catalytic domain-containing protein n=1 Tax=Solanum stoloniferum TaxID=62892 RepID=A0ABD2U1L5_9SOLN